PDHQILPEQVAVDVLVRTLEQRDDRTRVNDSFARAPTPVRGQPAIDPARRAGRNLVFARKAKRDLRDALRQAADGRINPRALRVGTGKLGAVAARVHVLAAEEGFGQGALRFCPPRRGAEGGIAEKVFDGRENVHFGALDEAKCSRAAEVIRYNGVVPIEIFSASSWPVWIESRTSSSVTPRRRAASLTPNSQSFVLWLIAGKWICGGRIIRGVG